VQPVPRRPIDLDALLRFDAPPGISDEARWHLDQLRASAADEIRSVVSDQSGWLNWRARSLLIEWLVLDRRSPLRLRQNRSYWESGLGVSANRVDYPISLEIRRKRIL
jgi:hypothetical protein